MQTKYLQIFISAENKDQADKILDTLLQKKLVAGGLLLNGPTRFWWKGKIEAAEYYNISTFTIEKHKGDIISEVKKVSIEEVPMIWFTSIDGNEEFLRWIDESVF